MSTAHIIYWNYLTPSGDHLSIGGIQTYITNLIEVLIGIGYGATVYQRGDQDFHITINSSTDVYGIKRSVDKKKGFNKILYDFVKKKINSNRGDIVIFASEELIVETDRSVPVFAIQHGISWDVPEKCLSTRRYLFRYLKKQYDAYRKAQQIKKVNHLICVDCNFINWYKALVPYPQVNLHYIPNFSALPKGPIVKPPVSKGTNIIFARRLFEKRGTRLFMAVAKRILEEYPLVSITIAGEGPDERLLRDNLAYYSHVRFIRYDSNDSLQVHSDMHIAVIPTIGSEGTSLSLLEAMAAGCAVVCTNVGGMTNVVIDGYNGLLITPNEDELYHSIKRLLDNDIERQEIAKRGYESIVSSFSFDKWRNSWRRVLK